MKSVDYFVEGVKKFLPNTQEFLCAYWRHQPEISQGDITMCLENAETGEIRELWYKHVDKDTENFLNAEFMQFFDEHFESLNGRKYHCVHSSLIAECWMPDSEHRQEGLSLYRRLEKNSEGKIAVVVLYLGDWSVGKGRELWHTRVNLSDNLREGRWKEKLDKILDEHCIALKGRDCLLLASPLHLKTANGRWLYRRTDNKCVRGVRVDALKSANVNWDGLICLGRS